MGSFLTYRLSSKRDKTARETQRDDLLSDRLKQLDIRIDECEDRHRKCLEDQAELREHLGRLEVQVATLEKKQ